MSMHVFFSGISGAAIGPLALIAQDAGFDVSGSDRQHSHYIDYLKSKGVTRISIDQNNADIAQLHAEHPIDWIVYSSAVSIENPNHPELVFARENEVRLSKRDEFLNELLQRTNKKLIAVAGTHGKTTTTAMTIWAFKQLNIPISYSVGAKLSFGDMGEYDPQSEYFVYEADEFDRNFLAFTPKLAVITGIDWDHPDIYPTRDEYYQAFVDFIHQSEQTVLHPDDHTRLGNNLRNTRTTDPNRHLNNIRLTGIVNRMNALVVVDAISKLVNCPFEKMLSILNEFPGVSRRFEQVAPNIYSDYAHTPEKIRGAIQAAHEVSNNVVVVYEGLHNTRQHFIKDDLAELFKDVQKLYIVPSYLAREDPALQILTPHDLAAITDFPQERMPAQLNKELAANITDHAKDGSLVLCLSAGGAKSLDEWLRATFRN